MPDEKISGAGGKAPHFKRVSSACFPCAVDYDYVAKLETLETDMAYILPHYNTTVEKHGIPHKNNRGLGLYPQNYVDAFVNLPADVFNDLLKKYKMDFDLFNYTLGDFFNKTTLKKLAQKGVILF